MKRAATDLFVWFSVVLVLSFVFLVASIAIGGGLDLGKLDSAKWLDGKKIPVVESVKAKKVSVIQFWASWCKGCGGNMEVLSRLTRGEPDLGFYSLSIDEDIKDAVTYFKLRSTDEYIAAFPTALWDEDMRFSTLAKVGAVPYFIVVTEKGEVLKRFLGHVTPAVEKEVKDLVVNHLRSEGEKNTKEGKK